MNKEQCNRKHFRDCQLNWLKESVLQAEIIVKTTQKNDNVIQLIKLLENFIRLHAGSLICYGGTAINNILPVDMQFYEETDIADYDLYSTTPIQHAKELADFYYKEGYTNISVKPATFHVGTFKIYVNFIAVADVTFLPPIMFDSLLREALIINGIYYCSPDFLRMNIMRELACPLNQPDRLEKVFLRFQLLHTCYPEVGNSNSVPVKSKQSTQSAEQNCILLCLIENNVVFLGDFAYSFYTSYPSPPNIIDALCVDTFILSRQLMARLVKCGCKPTDLVFKEETLEPRFCRVDIYIKKQLYAVLWKPETAFSYNSVPFSIPGDVLKSRAIRVASIETQVYYLYALHYLKYRPLNTQMVTVLLRHYFENRDNTGILRRFSIDCYGPPTTRETVLQEKHNKYNKYKHNKKAPEYQWYFLYYDPVNPIR